MNSVSRSTCARPMRTCCDRPSFPIRTRGGGRIRGGDRRSAGGPARPVGRTGSTAADIDPTAPETAVIVADLVATMRVSPAVSASRPRRSASPPTFSSLTSPPTRRPAPAMASSRCATRGFVTGSQWRVGREGCMSVPDLTGDVRRAGRITVVGQAPVTGKQAWRSRPTRSRLGPCSMRSTTALDCCFSTGSRVRMRCTRARSTSETGRGLSRASRSCSARLLAPRALMRYRRLRRVALVREVITTTVVCHAADRGAPSARRLLASARGRPRAARERRAGHLVRLRRPAYAGGRSTVEPEPHAGHYAGSLAHTPSPRGAIDAHARPHRLHPARVRSDRSVHRCGDAGQRPPLGPPRSRRTSRSA